MPSTKRPVWSGLSSAERPGDRRAVGRNGSEITRATGAKPFLKNSWHRAAGSWQSAEDNTVSWQPAAGAKRVPLSAEQRETEKQLAAGSWQKAQSGTR